MKLLVPLLALFVHETRPGYLELTETAADRYLVLWKVPAKDEYRLAIRPRFPEGSTTSSAPLTYTNGEFYTERGALFCPGGLEGRPILIEGLAHTQTDVLVRVVRLDGSVQTALLKPASPTFTLKRAPEAWDVVRTYLTLGVEHILFGIDHLLFVLGLLFLVRGAKRLVATVTAFTVAHSITLGAATLGWVRVPSAPVEAVIALSILFVAVEILRAREGRQSLAQSSPWIIAFVFGLLHGFGFAGALSEVGLPTQSIPLALLFFNVGVELGQLAFVAVALACAWGVRRLPGPRPAWVLKAPAYAIGALAAFWTIERIAGAFHVITSG